MSLKLLARDFFSTTPLAARVLGTHRNGDYNDEGIDPIPHLTHEGLPEVAKEIEQQLDGEYGSKNDLENSKRVVLLHSVRHSVASANSYSLV